MRNRQALKGKRESVKFSNHKFRDRTAHAAFDELVVSDKIDSHHMPFGCESVVLPRLGGGRNAT